MSTSCANGGVFRKLKGLLKKPKGYKYKPLATNDSIRLLELLPRQDQDPNHCRLHHTSVKDAEDTYTAISYVWGDALARVDIFCDKGQTLNITTSLASALQAVRGPVQPRLMWANGICINQNDKAERRQQVMLMGEVFGSAKDVVVWLGWDVDGIAEDCFDLIRETNAYLDEQLEDYAILTSLPWFTRVWVVQEAALAKSCVLKWGREQMSITELYELCIWLTMRQDFAAMAGYQVSTGILCDVFGTGHCTYTNTTTWRTSLPYIDHCQDKINEEEISHSFIF
ncbi:heterokaryon incompatibility protein-domain-containing protein [Podospora didyma]|uniref:Heterokaryon incompatibility protein-domain-containing protein n=1 Tax=Podospora didyma TaxID=330526 RepID=A0AAE0NSH9_9PEZI|nr:heterokaryon incompatibility protein-domain-containing protein [Podospora didyma]